MLGVAFIALNAVVWLTGELMSINLLSHLGSFGFIIGMLWALIGTQKFRLLLFPLLYLYFGIPEGDFLVPYLQDLTAKVVVFLLRASDIPVFLEGRYLAIPSGNFHVAKACSGINYLIATLAVGTMFAYLRFRSGTRRALFMLLAIFVPLAANGVRAYGIVMIAHLSEYKYAMGVDHFIYGWLFFGVVIFALFSIGNLFSDEDDSSQPAEPKLIHDSPRYSLSTVFICGIALVVGTRAFAINVSDIGHSSLAFQLPESTSGWQLIVVPKSPLGSNFVGAAVSQSGSYAVPGDEQTAVDIEAHYYRHQARDAEIINFSNEIYDDKIWRRMDGPTVHSTGTEVVGNVNQFILKSGVDFERVVWAWYDISGSPTLNQFTAKALSIKGALSDNYLGEVAIIISTLTDGDLEASTDRLRRFLREVEPTIAHMTSVRD